MLLFHDLASTSNEVSATRSRLAKVGAISELLRRADPTEVSVAVAYLSGGLRQRRTGLGWASFNDVPDPAVSPSLSITEVDEAFSRIAAAQGSGSAGLRRSELRSLLERATKDEQEFLRGLISGNLRQGALAGLMTDAVARAWDLRLSSVRRAMMLSGDLTAVAYAASTGGSDGLDQFRLAVGTPIHPMLAQSAPSLAAALEKTGPAAVEWKLDGVRVQVHRSGDHVDVFTRTLDRITDRVPEVVEAALRLKANSAILDGEAIALKPDGRPQPFQLTGSRVATVGIEKARTAIPLTVFFFDLLHHDGDDLIDLPASERIERSRSVIPPELTIERMVASSEAESREFVEQSLRCGHEGVVVKALDSTYEAGRRGAGWVKVKPHHTVDLVVLAVEWGHGRRHGWLSNLHLGALDASTGEFVMLGKTFKGLTDEMLRWQTKRLQELAIRDDGWTVWVRPELVVEIAFDGVQSSTRYPAGMALRFARVVRYREDKRPEEADTVEIVRSIHEFGV